MGIWSSSPKFDNTDKSSLINSSIFFLQFEFSDQVFEKGEKLLIIEFILDPAELFFSKISALFIRGTIDWYKNVDGSATNLKRLGEARLMAR